MASIDTTLTPEQQIYVDGLKKKMQGGANSKRSPYTSIPLREDLQPNSPFPPYIPDNAQALIDYALSHIPKRDGPRGTRKMKRMAKRFEFKNVHELLQYIICLRIIFIYFVFACVETRCA